MGSEQVTDSSDQKAGKTARVVTGRVVSNKMDKTIVVLIERKVKHAIYGKYMKRSTKLCAHDESNVCGIGDLVRIVECRPVSKRKAWRLLDVIETSVEAS